MGGSAVLQMTKWRGILAGMAMCVLLVSLGCGGDEGPVSQGDGMAGWERGGEYDSRYDPQELDRIKGYYVKAMDVTPLPGMAAGLAIVVRDRADDEMVTVHVAPKSFIAEDFNAFGLREGQKVKITGVWADFGEGDVFIASKVKKGPQDQLKVRRTKDGLPYWAMDEKLLATERANEFADTETAKP
jgi:hypothetical protein